MTSYITKSKNSTFILEAAYRGGSDVRALWAKIDVLSVPPVCKKQMLHLKLNECFENVENVMPKHKHDKLENFTFITSFQVH
jgi:hypothetical protein